MPADHGAEAQSSASLISNLVVRLTREHTGRGPTAARTYLDEDLVTVMLTQTFTKGEQSLIDDGHESHVLAMRKALQDTMRPDLVAGVEAIVGRPVIAFMSANNAGPDLAIETFVLEPLG